MHTTLPVTLSTDSGQARDGQLTIVQFDASERIKRAAKIWAFWWGLGLAAVVIPLLHFVLVPAFLIAGPVLGWLTYQRESLVMGGQSQCPKCESPFEISRSKLRWPIQDTCSKCHEPVWIKPKS